MNNSFQILNLDPRLISTLDDLQFETMTPIQEMALPHLLKNQDIIAQAKTGSGKTLAFALTILNKLNISQTIPQSLILCPTRELAEQVTTEIRKLARAIPNVKVLTITGGRSEHQQIKSLSHGAHIIIGTPGRTLKLLNNKLLSLEGIHTYVLDEADRMLDMGFSEDIFKINSFLSQERQTLLFSATFPENIQSLSHELQQDPLKLKVEDSISENLIQEKFIRLDSHKDKIKALQSILGTHQPKRFIVFCKTKRIADQVADKLYNSGVSILSIHGDLDQNERTAVLTQFSNKSICALSATDVAARGLDIRGLDLILNLDLPSDPEVYVHRIGRTGRAGDKGQAISFLTKYDDESFNKILDYQKSEHSLKEIDLHKETKPYEEKPPMITLYISGGKKDKLRLGDIVGAIVGESGIDASNVGDISVLSVTTYVAIKSEFAQLVCEKLNNGKIKKRNFKVGFLD